MMLSEKLDTLVRNLYDGKGRDGFLHMKDDAHYFFNSGDREMLYKQKGVFPYKMLSQEFCRMPLFEDDKFALQKKDSYDDLKEQEVSDEDYEYCQKLCREFNSTTGGKLHDMYLTTDVLQLAGVFEAFRDLTMDTYGKTLCGVLQLLL